MGLLDEAIREHLELKRRRGADPGAVAREEKEALGPTRMRVAQTDDDDEPDGLEDPATFGGAPARSTGTGTSTSISTGQDSHVTQETAELDMRTVLGAGAQDADDAHDGPTYGDAKEDGRPPRGRLDGERARARARDLDR
jgi:hypothetical protein